MNPLLRQIFYIKVIDMFELWPMHLKFISNCHPFMENHLLLSSNMQKPDVAQFYYKRFYLAVNPFRITKNILIQ